jgi:D-alanyl-D-alanine carboxypeptidase
MLAFGMKGWLVALVLTAVLGASVAGLWVTWDETRTSSADPVVGAAALVTTTSSRLGATTTLPPVPPCAIADEPVAGDPVADWATVVVDRARRLPDTLTPPDLVEVSQAGFDSRDQVRAIVIDDLAALRAAAEANGRVADVGEEQAQLNTARPGHSEHQLGTAIDVLDPGVGELTTAFAATPAGQWIAAHAHEFGFVVSYPDGASEQSCHEFEPWHVRYVGRDTAAAIHKSGLTPREWMLTRATSAG